MRKCILEEVAEERLKVQRVGLCDRLLGGRGSRERHRDETGLDESEHEREDLRLEVQIYEKEKYTILHCEYCIIISMKHCN